MPGDQLFFLRRRPCVVMMPRLFADTNKNSTDTSVMRVVNVFLLRGLSL